MSRGLIQKRPFREPWKRWGWWLALALLPVAGQATVVIQGGPTAIVWPSLPFWTGLAAWLIYRTLRPRVRLWVDGAGVHLRASKRKTAQGVQTLGPQRHWTLPWADVLGVHEVYTSGRRQYIALLHVVEPPPPVIAHPHEDNRSIMVPRFELAKAPLPDDHPAKGWCLIPTSELDAGHGVLLDACFRGVDASGQPDDGPGGIKRETA